ncbi:hypothetical protein [Sulfurisoma sediminicola]|uniref:Uncharacterized protein n=1 Tax=Sulfurisoma sediminicola TaxID=1381557 RepID=A0A497XJD8_9PROT|nr:hypothetical protein [Sulfurisoma sediminicola]RLJ68043.1 hypothetical protein DFR35_0597 [Sulfurisoma sediminicola]
MEVPAGDSARAETVLPLSVAELADFVRDAERLWRLNPHLDIRDWRPREDGFAYAAHDELGGRDVEAWVTVGGDNGRLTLRYATGLRQATEIIVEAAADGAHLIVIDHYPRIEDPQDPRLAEVDRTLVPWVAAIRRHLLARRRWRWLPGWRWWNERFLLHMAPRSRRIVRLLVWISVLEFLVFLGAVAVLRLAS